MSAEPARVASAAQTRLPDFFIVGHAKSGTTALYEMLRRHPQVFLPDSKEPWFFATDMRPRFEPMLGGMPPATLEEYLSLFAGVDPGRSAGEASSSYLWSRTAAARIAQVQPQARIVAILREPASFLRSLHLQLLQTHVESEKDLRRAVSLEAARRKGKGVPRRSHRPQLLQYADHVRYAEQLRRYHEVFPAEQILVLIYEDFRRDNAGTLRTVLRFLGVEDTHPIEALQANPTIGLRSQQLDDMVHAVSVGRGPIARGANAALKAVTPRDARRRLLRLVQQRVVHSRPPPADDGYMLELRRRFKGEVLAASEYLDRDLVSAWGYDRLD
jgi:sulfotransferase family protein